MSFERPSDIRLALRSGAQVPTAARKATARAVGPSPRRSRDERVAAITAATRRLLAERGYESVLTTEIAQLCGISEGTIFRYFPTKRDLLVTVAEAWFEEIISLRTAEAAAGSYRDRLRREIGLALSLIREEPSLARFVLTELRPDPSYRTTRLYQLNRRFTARILAVLKDALAAGKLRQDVPAELLRDMIFGSIEHQTWAFLRGEGEFSAELAADAITTVVWRGMAEDPAEARSWRFETALDRLDDLVTRLGGAAS